MNVRGFSSYSFLCTDMAVHGAASKEFAATTIIPILPKKHYINVVDSNNFTGIALSSIFCKLFYFLIMLF
jgi:hypothetical protein